LKNIESPALSDTKSFVSCHLWTRDRYFSKWESYQNGSVEYV